MHIRIPWEVLKTPVWSGLAARLKDRGERVIPLPSMELQICQIHSISCSSTRMKNLSTLLGRTCLSWNLIHLGFFECLSPWWVENKWSNLFSLLGWKQWSPGTFSILTESTLRSLHFKMNNHLAICYKNNKGIEAKHKRHLCSFRLQMNKKRQDLKLLTYGTWNQITLLNYLVSHWHDLQINKLKINKVFAYIQCFIFGRKFSTYANNEVGVGETLQIMQSHTVQRTLGIQASLFRAATGYEWKSSLLRVPFPKWINSLSSVFYTEF